MVKYFKDNKVSIPSKDIRIYSNGYIYYLVSSTYSKTGKRCDEKRIIIGKKCNDKEMIPNENYYICFKPNDILVEPPKIDSYLHFGQYIACKEVLKLLGAYDALSKSFDDKFVDKLIALSLSMFSCENCVSQNYDGWAFSNYSGLTTSLSSGNISEIYKSITPEKVESFLSKYQKNYHQVFQNHNYLDCYAFDSTNQNTSSTNIEIAEFGKAKDPDNLKIINTAYITDEETGIPIYYEHFLGSLLDKNQIVRSNEKLNELGYQNLFFIFDRGYYSKNSIIEVMKNNKVALLVPETVSSTKKIIDNYIDTIKNKEEYYIPTYDVYGIKTVSSLFLSKELYVYIYYDDNTSKVERDSIHGKLISLESRIQSISKLNDDVIRSYETYFELSQGKEHIETKRKHDVIQSYLNRAGFFIVVSNRDISVEEMIKIVKSKDSVEKSFRRIKSTFDAAKTYCHNGITYEGKMFVLFIAILMSQGLFYYLRKYMKEISSRTLRTVMNELNKVLIYKSNKQNKWLLKYALTKQIKEIYNYLNIDENKVQSYLDEVKL